MHQLNVSTVYRQELKGRIIQAAAELFSKFGIKAVKMDDVAKHLSISKRTLYEIYANKEELLLEMVKQRDSQLKRHLDGFVQGEDTDVMDCIIEFYRAQVREFATVNPLFFEELHIYPKLVEYFDERGKERKKRAAEFLRMGVKSGYFLKDVNYELMQQMGEDVSKRVFETETYKKYPLEEIFRNLIRMFLRAICTEKGIRRLDEGML